MFDVALENRTPFDAATHVQMDVNGQEVLVAVISATFAAGADDSLSLASEQIPMCFADECFGEPGQSSIRREADIALVKPRVDVVVVGAAYAPLGRAVPEVVVSLRIADIYKPLHVVGDRSAATQLLNGPLPFTRMPIVYERAFGGTVNGDVFPENPVGVGYRRAVSRDPTVTTELPNIGYPAQPSNGRRDHPLPAGFGIIARNWAPRVSLAGTYDQKWVDSVWPLPPQDFDPLFDQAAPPDQQLRTVFGGENVELINMTASGAWRFRLPRLDVPIRLVFENRIEEREIRIDTVLIDTERCTVTLKARIAVTTVRNSPRLMEIALGHVSSAWLRARQLKKDYRGRREPDGARDHRPTFYL